MTRVLVLCTHNSARSQMAEGWLRRHAGDRGLELDVLALGRMPTVADVAGETAPAQPLGLA